MLELDQEQSFYKTFANDEMFKRIKQHRIESMRRPASDPSLDHVSPSCSRFFMTINSVQGVPLAEAKVRSDEHDGPFGA